MVTAEAGETDAFGEQYSHRGLLTSSRIAVAVLGQEHLNGHLDDLLEAECGSMRERKSWGSGLWGPHF